VVVSAPASDPAAPRDLLAEGRRRPIRPDAPVLLVGRTTWWEENGLDDAMRTADWSFITADDVPRARWLASIRRVSLVVVGGDHEFRWRAVDDIRDLTDVPMVVLADDVDEVVTLVKAGVDAVCPTSEPSRTMLARLAAVFRRADRRRGPGVRYLRALELQVDLWTRSCSVGGAPLALSPTEYDLLTFLMSRPSVTLPTTTILRRVWDPAPADGRNALRITVNRVRRKLGDSARSPRYISSIRGNGYRFIANVTEEADALTDHALHADVTPLVSSIAEVAEALVSCADDGAAAEVLVGLLDAAGVADGLAVFRSGRTRMHLLAAARMPDAWLERVADGIPLDPSFASAQSVLSGEVVQFADVRAVRGQFRSTADSILAEGFRACHFVPIDVDGRVWGHLGLVRRTESPLDAVTMAYLRSLCAVFALHLTGRP
jgi:DNA-binding response OmpR family regulator